MPFNLLKENVTTGDSIVKTLAGALGEVGAHPAAWLTQEAFWEKGLGSRAQRGAKKASWRRWYWSGDLEAATRGGVAV